MCKGRFLHYLASTLMRRSAYTYLIFSRTDHLSTNTLLTYRALPSLPLLRIGSRTIVAFDKEKSVVNLGRSRKGVTSTKSVLKLEVHQSVISFPKSTRATCSCKGQEEMRTSRLMIQIAQMLQVCICQIGLKQICRSVQFRFKDTPLFLYSGYLLNGRISHTFLHAYIDWTKFSKCEVITLTKL